MERIVNDAVRGTDKWACFYYDETHLSFHCVNDASVTTFNLSTNTVDFTLDKTRHWNFIDGVLRFEGTVNEVGERTQGKSYTSRGVLEYDGEWRGEVRWGNGISYHDDGKTPRCVGEFHDMYEGTEWFDCHGKPLDRSSWENGIVSQSHACTYDVSGREYVPQRWYTCMTCTPQQEEDSFHWFFEQRMGCCLACAKRCHQGHVLHEEDFSDGGFFCDCGAGDLPEPCKARQECEDTTTCNCGEPVKVEEHRRRRRFDFFADVGHDGVDGENEENEDDHPTLMVISEEGPDLEINDGALK
jgi:hypothetical protein